jgi:hypothetical protein
MRTIRKIRELGNFYKYFMKNTMLLFLRFSFFNFYIIDSTLVNLCFIFHSLVDICLVFYLFHISLSFGRRVQNYCHPCMSFMILFVSHQSCTNTFLFFIYFVLENECGCVMYRRFILAHSLLILSECQSKMDGDGNMHTHTSKYKRLGSKLILLSWFIGLRNPYTPLLNPSRSLFSCMFNPWFARYICNFVNCSPFFMK